jgi:hypothetical protein
MSHTNRQLQEHEENSTEAALALRILKIQEHAICSNYLVLGATLPRERTAWPTLPFMADTCTAAQPGERSMEPNGF